MTPKRYPLQRIIALGVCARCGEVHQFCTAHNKAGNPCGRAALLGMTVCPLHGGRAPQVKAAAERNIAEAEATKALNRLTNTKGKAIDDPALELARLAGEVLAWKDAAADLVAGLSPNDPDSLVIGQGYDVHPLVKLAERAQDRAKAILAEMVKLGLVERSVAIEESQVALVQVALAAALTEAGIDPATVLPVLAVKLRELDAVNATGTEA